MILWLIGKLSGAAGSAVAAATVSTVLTAATAVPMTVAALEAEPSLDSEISSEDLRFPPPVEADGNQLAVAPTTAPTDAGRPADTNDRDDEELALVRSTPTAETGSTPEVPRATPSRPSTADPPDAAPLDPTPQPTPAADTEPETDPTPMPATEVPRPTPTNKQSPAPAPSPTATAARPTATVVAPTPAPTSTATPTAAPTQTPAPGADVSAYISPRGSFNGNSRSNVVAKATNDGPATATAVRLTVSISGGTIAGVSPRAGWSCGPGGTTVVCSTASLAPSHVGSIVVDVDPGSGDTLTVSVAATHSGTDPNPGNNVTSATFAIRERDDD